ncbi:MAG: alpha-L-fucosidase [Rikenellaceae bacterium]
MRQKLFLVAILLLLTPTLLAQTAPKEGLEKLCTIYRDATELLDGVRSADDLPLLVDALLKTQNKYREDAEVEAALLITPATCPNDIAREYQRALKGQQAMRDAGKRLAMGGILSSGEGAEVYSSFTEQFNLSAELDDTELQEEGAAYESQEDRDKRMAWWRDAKFAMFIHYGLFSALAGEVQGKEYEGCVEWIQQRSGLDSETYAEETLPIFKPRSGCAEEWVKLAKESGCKYVVLTSRHHEGFNMWDTKDYDFNVVKHTGVDVVKEYSEACEKYDIKAGYYFSLLDWGHPDYDPTGSGISYPEGNYIAEKEGRRTFGNHEKYKEYLYSIFCDLTENYKVDLVWWDFSQPNFQGDKAWGATALMKRLNETHPNAIQNNRLFHSDNHISEGSIKVTPTRKGDYSTAEQHVPPTGIAGDWEACQTLNGTWGYSATNQNWKSSESLIRELIDAVSRGGNYLLNIGPMGDGSIPEQSVVIFKEMGEWMSINGEAIYGTRANPFDVELTWGRVTRKGDDRLYLFVYEKPDSGVIELPCIFARAKASVVGSGKRVKCSSDKKSGVTSFDISSLEMDSAATVIEVRGVYSHTL